MSSREADLELESELTFLKPNASTLSKSMFHLRGKRVIDIHLALIGLIVLLPVFLIVAVLLKWHEPRGTVFYKQIRMGKNGKQFWMFKFRSMVTNADSLLGEVLHLNEIEGAMFKMKNDPRITPIGRFIRKTSIDELPQLYNVLKGDMSLVGPRPALPREVETYTAYERQRLRVIPGCTGLWQVSGRNQLSFRKMLELDLQYISKWSLWLDFKIIFKTIFMLFGSKDAY